MEPNPHASPVPPGGGSPDWMAMSFDTARLSADRSSAGFAGSVTSAVADPPVLAATPLASAHVATGHSPYTNGHANGHSNGAASWPALVTVTTAATYAPAIPAGGVTGESLYLRFGKRALDIAGALIGLVLCAPLLVIAALAIRLESRGPILYRSIRVGRGGRPFTFFKLRSMMDGADRHRQKLTHLNECDGPVFKMARDPRVTRVGRLLRTSSVDEIPQLLNVLKGEMSLVGPRPPIPQEVAQYEPWQLRRLDVLPGITCLWQISGRSRIGFQEWMRLDLEYIKHQSFWLDVKILVRTIPAVLSREGAY